MPSDWFSINIGEIFFDISWLRPAKIPIFSSTGHRPASLCHGPLSVVGQSVRPCVNFFFKIFFSETTYQILMRFHGNVPAMVLFRIS